MTVGIIPYIIVFLIGCYNLYSNTKNSNNFFFFMLFLLGALRQDVGFDYMAYDDMIFAGRGFAVERIEPIEKWLIEISHEYFHQLFFIVNSFIAVYFTKMALERESKDISISAMAFLCFPLMFTNSFSIIRFWSALALVFYASTLLKDKKYIIFGLFVFIAIGFHMAAIIAVLFIPLYVFRIPLTLNFIILGISFIGGEFILSRILAGGLPENMFTDRLALYAGRESVDGLSKIPYLYMALDIFFLLTCHKQFNNESDGYRWVTIFNAGVSLLFLLSFQVTLAVRLSRPFLLYFMFLMPFAVKFEKVNRVYKSFNVRRIGYALICLFLFIYLLTIYNETLGRSQFLPYKFFFA